MKLPNKIKVGNLVYDIVREDHDGFLGLHCYGENDTKIILDTRLTGDKLRNVFFHELVHAIFHEIGADEENLNEILIQSLANELDKLFELKK